MNNVDQQIHDIRSPLNSICMQAELIKMLSESTELSAELQKAANKIIESSKQCSGQLQALFDSLST